MGRITGAAEIGEANQRGVGSIDLERSRGCDAGERLYMRGQAMLVEQLGEHGRCCLVKWATTSDAQHGMIDTPIFVKAV